MHSISLQCLVIFEKIYVWLATISTIYTGMCLSLKEVIHFKLNLKVSFPKPTKIFGDCFSGFPAFKLCSAFSQIGSLPPFSSISPWAILHFTNSQIGMPVTRYLHYSGYGVELRWIFHWICEEEDQEEFLFWVEYFLGRRGGAPPWFSNISIFPEK